MVDNAIGTQTQQAGYNPYVKKSKSGDLASTATVGILGGTAGYFMGEPIATSKIYGMDADKFTNSLKNADKMTPNQKMAVENIKDALNYKQNFSEAVDGCADELFQGKDKITVKEYLTQNINKKIASKGHLEKLIKIQGTHSQNLTNELTNISERLNKLKAEAVKLQNDELATNFEKITKNNQKIEESEKTLANIKAKLADHLETVAKNKEYLDVVNLAKDGEITKDAIKGYSKSTIVAPVTECIESNAKGISKYLPKVKSFKNAGLTALMGIGIAVITSESMKLLAGKKKAKA